MKLESGSRLKYIPKGTTYNIILSDIQIKHLDLWVLGCVYVCEGTGKIFCRSYLSFQKGVEKWEVLDEGV